MEDNIKKDQSPVYDFLGYRLLKVSLFRNGSEDAEFFKVQVTNPRFLDLFFSFQINIIIKYPNNEESALLFDAGFKINDMKWKEGIGGDDQLSSILFSVVFPFIREKIFSLTNDNRRPLHIPIIDLRFADLSKGIEFTKRKLKKTLK